MQWEAALQLHPTIVNFKTWDLGSKEIRRFRWKEMKNSNYSVVPSLLDKNTIL